jgi:hypothetical protein
MVSICLSVNVQKLENVLNNLIRAAIAEAPVTTPNIGGYRVRSLGSIPWLLPPASGELT